MPVLRALPLRLTLFLATALVPILARSQQVCTFDQNPLTDSGVTGWAIDIVARLNDVYLTPSEKHFLASNPGLVRTIMRIRESAKRISKTLCGTRENAFYQEYNDEETDAVRHFVGAALFAAHLGFETSWYYLNAHEFTKRDDARNRMDRFNNALGIEFGKTFYSGQPKSEIDPKIEEAATKKALELLEAGKFNILHSGQSKCARPQVYKGLPDRDWYWSSRGEPIPKDEPRKRPKGPASSQN